MANRQQRLLAHGAEASGDDKDAEEDDAASAEVEAILDGCSTGAECLRAQSRQSQAHSEPERSTHNIAVHAADANGIVLGNLALDKLAKVNQRSPLSSAQGNLSDDGGPGERPELAREHRKYTQNLREPEAAASTSVFTECGTQVVGHRSLLYSECLHADGVETLRLSNAREVSVVGEGIAGSMSGASSIGRRSGVVGSERDGALIVVKSGNAAALEPLVPSLSGLSIGPQGPLNRHANRHCHVITSLVPNATSLFL